MRRKFRPHFSNVERARRKLVEHQEAITLLHHLVTQLRSENARLEQDKKGWMDRALRKEFEQHRASGCYTNCPVFIIDQPGD